ncbi:MAG: hypothetical protein PF517_18845 [Salinivirgaceae bacterium]|jgi:hypothetical protein|nr:hypothetical protein [Salinivirgaceae bacterium]
MKKQADNKITKLLKQILELVWLIVALLALGIAIKETINIGFSKSFLYYLFSGVAVFFFFSRRRERMQR